MTKVFFSISKYIFSQLYFLLFISLITVAFIPSIYGQNLGNSPYSTYGIGDLNPTGLIRNVGMGNTGISNGHSEFINNMNPALLPVSKGNNKDSTLKFTMLDFSLNGIARNLKQGEQTQQSGGVNLAYVNFLFPLSKHWSTAVGLRPYSSVLNKFQTIRNFNDSTTNQIEYFSKGSINQVSIDNGYDVSKNFSLGLHLGYLFGSVAHRNTVYFPRNNSAFNQNRIGANYRDYTTAFEIKPGIAYRLQLKDSAGAGSGIFFNAGVTYNQLLKGRSKRTVDLVFINSADGQSVLSDSLRSTKYFDLDLPSELAGGISFERPGKWTLAADFTYSTWAVYKDIYGQKFLNNSYSVALGGEWKPAKSITLRSPEYRAGFNYTKSPIAINGVQLDDFSFSLGTTVPVGRKDARYKSKPLNKLNAALVLGTRGTTSQNMVQEQYIKMYFGVVIQDKWFQRWKID